MKVQFDDRQTFPAKAEKTDLELKKNAGLVILDVLMCHYDEKKSFFLSLCIYNLEVLTYNTMKPFIEILTRSHIILALFHWVEAGCDAIQSTQIDMATSVRSATYEKVRLTSVIADIL